MSGKGNSGRSRLSIEFGGSSNRLSLILVLIVVVSLFIMVAVSSASLKQQLDEYNERIQELEEEIAEEEARAEELEEYSVYTQTDEYVEETAREKLGLVKEGEILFKNDGDSYTASEDDGDDADAVTGAAESTDSPDAAESTDSDSAAEETDSADADAAESAEEGSTSAETQETDSGTESSSSESYSIWEPITQE